jgi:hypothetical protein
MGTLIGEFPRTQLIDSRLLRSGDHIAKADQSFAVIANVMYAEEIDFVTIETIDGAIWLGDGDKPFPIAVSRDAAAEWNRRRAELDLREQMKLLDSLA